MKIQTPTEFLTFGDGVAEIWEVKGNKSVQKMFSAWFGDRTVGMKRYYDARSAGVQIDRAIHVHYRDEITSDDRVKINGTEYKIEQIQKLKETNPPVCVLTLRRIGT